MAAKKIKSVTSLLTAEAAKVELTDFSLNMPLYVLLGESIDVARFCEHYWKAQHDPKTKKVTRPGLELAGEERLPKVIAEEIVTLQELVQKSQTAYLLAIVPPNESNERAEFVLEELSAAIAWVCDDGVQDEKDAKLAALIEAHREDPESEDALASELSDYLGLAIELGEELAAVEAFDPDLIDEAKQLVLALRERSAVRVRGKGTEASSFLSQRNQYAAILIQRMNRVRAAARYVFRHHDEIVKQVTSAYQRRRRAAARRRASENSTGTEPSTTTPPPALTELAPTE